MKTLREDNFFGPIVAGQEYLLEEPAWRDADGVPQFTVDGAPKGCPSWQPEDLVVLYVGGRQRTAGLLEVVGFPYESGKDDWPWSTDTTAVAGKGPTLDDLGVPHEMVNRRVRWRLDEAQAVLALRAFGV
ncbi:MAG TPA: hypothetical protein VI299_01150 [Polyangiales bacterium]